MSERRKILRHTLSMGVAGYIAQMLGMVTSIAIRAFLGPAAMGIWTILQVILGYCGYASFGTTKAMARDYPMLRGRGEHEKAEHLKNLTLTFSMTMSIIPAILILLYTIWRWPVLELPFKVGLIFLAGFLFLQRFYDLIITLLRSDKRFDILSEVTVLNALGMLAIVFLFVWPFGIYGMLIGSFLTALLCLAYIGRRQPYHFLGYWNTPELLQQLKLAVPLLAISLLTTFYKSIDKLLIAKYLGFADVGFYSITMMVAQLVFAFPMVLANVLYPHTLEAYGRKQSLEVIEKHLMHPTLILSVTVPVVCGLAMYLLPLVVEWFIPKFVPGLPAMKIYLIGTFFVLTAQFASNVLTTLDKYWINIPILLVSCALNVIANLLFIRMGFGLNGVALGTALSFLVYGLLTFFAAAINVESVRFALKRTGRILILNVLIFAGIYFIDILPLGKSMIAACILKIVVMLIFSIPFVIYLEKKLSILSQLYRMFIERKAKKGPSKDSYESEVLESEESVFENPK